MVQQAISQDSPYFVRDNRTYKVKKVRGGRFVEVLLANFTAKIVKE